MDFKHEIIALKHRGDKIHVDENVSDHGTYEVGDICPKMQPLYLCVNCTFDCIDIIVHVIWVVVIITLLYVKYNLTLQQYMQNTW